MRALEDEHAVLAALCRSGHAQDYRDEESWPQSGVISGRKRLRQVFHAHTHTPQTYTSTS